MASFNPRFPLFLFILGSACLLAGERIFGVGHGLRLLFSGMGMAFLLAAFPLRVWLAMKAANGRGIHLRVALHYGLGVVGLGLYGLSLASAAQDFQLILRVAWPIFWLVGLLPLFLMEQALLSMSSSPVVEGGRVRTSGRSGASIALALSWLMALNFVADQHDKRFDFRTVKDLVPSESTQEMSRNLSEPITMTLFFPPASDVLEAVDPYFSALAQLSPNITLVHMDKDVSPRQAKEMRVRSNGSVVLSKGEIHESLRLGIDLKKARRKLKSLDKDFQSKLAKVAREQRVVYVVTGHGERSLSPRSDEPAPGLRDLKKVLISLNYAVKRLGVSEGLTTEVPEDATLVIVAGPTSPMLQSEVESLSQYLKGGGALMLLLDPDIDSDPELDGLLKGMGLAVDFTPLVNETKYARLSGGASDKSVLFTNRFMAHESTQALARLSTQVALVFPTTGSLTKIKGLPTFKEGGPDVRTTIRSLPETFADLNGDLRFGDGEKKAVFDLVVAINLPASDDGEKGGRAIVTADVDLITDQILRLNAGNQQWLVDAIHFLEDDIELIGALSASADSPIMHSRDEDQALFYSTVMGVPFLLLVLGAAIRRRSQKYEDQG